jgi:predicted ATP-binding protein involved in virulence
MWIEEIILENIKCFEHISLKFGSKESPTPWISLLGENGGGKSTVLQAIGLALAGYEGSVKLLNQPIGWIRDSKKVGKISARIHQNDNDPGTFGKERVRSAYGYTFVLIGEEKISYRNKIYTEPAIIADANKTFTWLRHNALTSKGHGWFGAGYGAFRRLTRKSEIIVPSLQMPERYTNFLTQFNEDEPLASFERWLVYLDYKIAKDKDKKAERQKELGIEAINKMLPEGNRFDSVTSDGRIMFDVKGKKVPTIALSDGFRSVLALSGDLVWRLLEAFPESKDPLKEHGVVLIDELDIHLHPTWQRSIAGWLREQFPNIQFIVATHSPLIVAGAGINAVTYKLDFNGYESQKYEIKDLAFLSIDKILQSDAFQLVSPYSPETQAHLDQYVKLKSKKKRTKEEENLLQQSLIFVQKVEQNNTDTPLEQEIKDFLAQKLSNAL